MTRLHAVLIGINRYADPSIPDLRFARADAEQLAELLERSEYHQDLRTHLLLDADARRADVIDLIGTDLSLSAREQDIVLVYFAGHGSPEVHPSLDQASRFLVCHDSRREMLLSSAIDIGTDLPRLAARLPVRLVLFVLDACFSGYSGGRGIIGPALEHRRRTYRPSLRLEELPLGEGLAFMTAASDDEVAWEEEALGHGVFSFHLLSELAAAGAGTVVGLATLYDLVFSRVRARTGGRQNPVLWGNLKGASLPRFVVEREKH